MKWPPWLYRFLPHLGRRQAEEDLQEELRLHLDLERERQRDAGVPDTDALRAARRTLGNATLIRERTRDVWGWRWLDDLGRDLRHALRGLGRSPGFAVTVVLVLALGIGANAAMFSIVYGMLIRPLPYRDAGSIVRVGHVRPARRDAQAMVSNITFPGLQEAESFEHLAAYASRTFVWSGRDGPRILRGAMVSPALFPLLRATPHLGRLFTDRDARPAADRVALLSYGAWTNHFVSDPAVVGAPLDLDGEPFTVVGVVSEGFSFPSPEEEIWTPWAVPPFESGNGVATMAFSFTALGRLRPAVSPEQAAAEIDTILNTAARGGPSGLVPNPGRPAGSAGPQFEARVIPLQEELVRGHRPALLVLAAVAALVLAVACINVAGLFLARGTARRRELAVRGALGAGRGRIARQLLTESLVLSVAGGTLGLAAAALILRAAPALAPGAVPRLDEAGVGGMVLVFTAGLSILVGLVLGAAPALSWSRPNLLHSLSEGSTQVAGGFRVLPANLARAALAVAQVALALVLLVGAGLLLRSFVELVSVDAGYDPANVLTARVNNPDLRLFSSEAADFAALGAANRRFYAALLDRLERLERLPGAEAAGVSSALPFADGRSQWTVDVPGRPPPDSSSHPPPVRVHEASPGYFDVLRLRLRDGRVFNRLDGSGSPRVAVVNETLERERFGGGPAVGRRLLFAGDDDPLEVVGVVADVKYRGLAAAGSPAEVYVPVRQSVVLPVPLLNPPLISVRTRGDPLAAVPLLREAVADVHPRAALDDVRTMEARLSSSVAQPRFQAVFVASFGAIALLLAMLGVYGLLSYTVAHRRREIGVRMALGAQRGDIVGLVVRQGAMLVAAGAVVGLAAAAASSRVLESFLYGIATDDRLTFLAAPLVLVAVALVACWLPARRATRVDPMEVLRFE